MGEGVFFIVKVRSVARLLRDISGGTAAKNNPKLVPRSGVPQGTLMKLIRLENEWV
jgi:hypothetical protein